MAARRKHTEPNHATPYVIDHVTDDTTAYLDMNDLYKPMSTLDSRSAQNREFCGGPISPDTANEETGHETDESESEPAERSNGSHRANQSEFDTRQRTNQTSETNQLNHGVKEGSDVSPEQGLKTSDGVIGTNNSDPVCPSPYREDEHHVRFETPPSVGTAALEEKRKWARISHVFDLNHTAEKTPKATILSCDREQQTSTSSMAKVAPNCTSTTDVTEPMQKTIESFTGAVDALNASLNQTVLALREMMERSHPCKPPATPAAPVVATEPQPCAGPERGGEAKKNTRKLKTRACSIHEIKRSQKTDVYVRLSFLKIGEIDTIKEAFTADVLIQARWREPLLDHQQHLDEDKIEWKKYWSPKIYLDNTLGETAPSTWHTLLFDTKGKATVAQKFRINANFLETMELDQFPFDSQDLTVTLAADRPHTEVALIEDEDEPSSINTQSFVDEQEWSLHSHLSVSHSLTQKSEHEKSWKIPTFSVSGKARRRPGFFVWNILVVMFLISALAFATFAVSIDLPQNRLQLGFTLVLTSVAFKFVANQNIPKISYLTYLDKYILLSMSCLAIICGWHALIAQLHDRLDESLCHTLDRYAMITAAAIFALFHLVFLLLIYSVSVRRRVMYAMKDLEHERMVEKVRMKKARKKLLANKVAAAPLLFSILQHARNTVDTSGSPSRAQDSPSRAQDSPSRAQDSPSRAQDSPSRAQDSPSRAHDSHSRAQGSPSRPQDSPYHS